MAPGTTFPTNKWDQEETTAENHVSEIRSSVRGVKTTVPSAMTRTSSSKPSSGPVLPLPGTAAYEVYAAESPDKTSPFQVSLPKRKSNVQVCAPPPRLSMDEQSSSEQKPVQQGPKNGSVVLPLPRKLNMADMESDGPTDPLDLDPLDLGGFLSEVPAARRCSGPPPPLGTTSKKAKKIHKLPARPATPIAVAGRARTVLSERSDEEVLVDLAQSDLLAPVGRRNADGDRSPDDDDLPGRAGRRSGPPIYTWSMFAGK